MLIYLLFCRNSFHFKQTPHLLSIEICIVDSNNVVIPNSCLCNTATSNCVVGATENGLHPVEAQ